MADFGSPVAQNINPVGQGLTTLNDLMSFKRSQQALQTGQYQQQTARAQAQQEQQTSSQRQAAADFFQNYDLAAHVGPDGTLDLDKALTNPALKATGDAYPAIAKSLIDMKNSQLDGKTKLASLNGALRQQFYDNVGGLSADPDVKQGNNQGVGKVLDAIDQFGQSGGPDAQRVAAVYRPLIQNLAQAGKTDKLPEVLRNFQLQAQDAGRQTEQTYGTPTTINNGAVIQPGVQAPAAQGGGFIPQGAGISTQLPPQVIPNPLTGGQAVIGGAAGTTPRPIGGPPGALNPWQPYAGQQNDIRAFQQEVQGARSAADAAPTARNINAQILRLADNSKTGPGTEVWQHAVGALAAPFGLSPTANYQELGKFLEKNAIQNMQSMGGPPSDARLSAAAAANGSTHFSPEALKAVTKFNDATNTALMQYRQGLDRSVGMGQNVDYTKLPAFKAAWAKNFDVDVFRVENAIRDGDKPELAKIKSELGPEKLKALAQKRANLNALSQGQVPP